MTQALDQSIIELLHASRDDERTIQFDVADPIFGFHAQQAVEKLLKVLIGAHGERPAFTHDIDALVNHAILLGELIPVRIALIVSLSKYAGVWRYQEPDPWDSGQRHELRLEIDTLRISTIRRLAVLRPTLIGQLSSGVDLLWRWGESTIVQTRKKERTARGECPF